MQIPTAKIKIASGLLSLYLGVLLLGYCGIYLWACPTPQLAAASLAEGVCIVVSLIFFYAAKPKLPQAVQRWLRRYRLDVLIEHFDRVLTTARIIVLAVMCTLVTWDFAACGTAAFGNEAIAAKMYLVEPSTQLLGLHPAFSLECLGGALTDNGNFAKAEKIYLAILTIRTAIGGPRSDLVAAIDADMADLCVRKRDLAAAEQWFRKSVALGPEKGRALTGLATVLRQEGCFEESKQCYEQALTSRAQLFGRNSRQYGDTLRGYQKLLALMQARTQATTATE